MKVSHRPVRLSSSGLNLSPRFFILTENQMAPCKNCRSGYPRDALTRGDPIHVQLPKGKGRYAYKLSVENNGKVIFEKRSSFQPENDWMLQSPTSEVIHHDAQRATWTYYVGTDGATGGRRRWLRRAGNEYA